MKPTKFAKYLTEYLTVYLPNERGYSPNTVKSYRDNMLLLLTFMRDKYHIGAEKIDFTNITQERVVASTGSNPSADAAYLQETPDCHRYTLFSGLCSTDLPNTYTNGTGY